MRRYKDRRGVTLVELMVSVAVISIGILAFFGAFSFISKTLHVSRTRTLATNLAQEKIESLKNLSYYELLITTTSNVDNSFTPGIAYDNTNYPPETISIGGITFRRYTFVALAQIDHDVISTVTYTYPDTGMKQVTTYVTWVDGNTPKKWVLTNLYENPNVNPLDASVTGQVQDNLGHIMSGVSVRIDENPDWNATTDSGGNFTFRVYHGSYTVRASTAGYYDALSALMNVDAGSNVTIAPNPLQMTAIATGTVVGNAWYNPDLVISGVAVSSAMAGQNNFILQYIELYNPTTAAINIGVTGSVPTVKINHKAPAGCSNADDCEDANYGIKLVYNSTYVAPNHYYLVANTDTFTLNGSTRAADAVFTDDANTYCAVPPAGGNWNLSATPKVKQILDVGHGGSVWLQRGSGPIIDAVGWQHNGNIPDHYEGTYLTITGNAANGFPVNEQIVRISSPMANLAQVGMDLYGHAYDSGNNAGDFIYDPVITTIVYPPNASTTTSKIPIAGVPAVGAVVASSDPYSGSATAAAAYISSGALSLLYARYTLPGVTTGTWQVTIATSGYFNQFTPVNIFQGVTVGVPNGATTPSWPASNVMSAFLSSAATTGFIKGQVTDINNNAVNGVTVTGGGGTKNTGANGGYFIAVGTGAVTVVVNPNNTSAPQYVQVEAVVNVDVGQVVTQNFMLSKGGALQGYLTSGTTPLPNYPVAATIGGNQYGSGTSNTSGIFTIRNLSTGTYTVAPVLEVGQDSSPNYVTSTVVSTGTVWIGTFTVSGALGSIAGWVKYNSQSVTTGSLIVASTSTISTTPPSIAASSSAALTPIYAISSKADGNYTLPVRGNNTYYLSVYVPNISGSSVVITTKTYSGIYVSPGVSTTKNLTVP